MRTTEITAMENWLDTELEKTDSLPAQLFLFGMPPLQGGIRKTDTPGVYRILAAAPTPSGQPEMMDVCFSCKYVVSVRLIDADLLPEVQGHSGIHLS